MLITINEYITKSTHIAHNKITADRMMYRFPCISWLAEMITITLTSSSMLQLEVFVSKLFSVDALAAGAIVIGEVASLAHETRNDTME